MCANSELAYRDQQIYSSSLSTGVHLLEIQFICRVDFFETPLNLKNTQVRMVSRLAAMYFLLAP